MSGPSYNQIPVINFSPTLAPPASLLCHRPQYLLSLLLLLLCVTGCGTTAMEEQLLGTWVGRPDSAAEREVRVPSPVSLQQDPSAVAQQTVDPAEPVSTKTSEGEKPDPNRTDLEAFDFRITLRFATGGEVEMWVGDKQDQLNGTWHLLSEEGSRAQIEIAAERLDEMQPPPQQLAKSGDKNAVEASKVEPPKEQRRFELLMEPEAHGFTLREVGADPRFGWLYFERQK